MPPKVPERRARHASGAAAALVAALVAAAGCVLAHAADTFDLAHLMQMLAGVRSGEATFVERREVRVLDRTLVSKGRLEFQAPDTFVRETLEPTRERIAITGDTLTMSFAGRRRTVPVDAAPEAAVIVEAIRGTLTGNRASLERHFEVRVSGTPAQWWLDLVPREARLRTLVQSVRVGGEQALVRRVEVYLSDGDRSFMTIEPKPSPNGDAPRARP
jgi:outer membrane lipoprotein-sorting protein